MLPEPINEFEVYSRTLQGNFPILLSVSLVITLAILAKSFFSQTGSGHFRTLHLSFGAVATGALFVSANRTAFRELAYISGDPMPFHTIGDLVIRNQIIGGYIILVGLATAATLLPKSKHNKAAMDKPDTVVS